MKLADTLRGLLKRWYILFPGLLIAVAIAVGAWFAIPPGYSRSATQLIVPGESSIPEGGNPYLYLGGLVPAADVLVRAVGSENTLNDVAEKYPGIDIEISRDATAAGPMILITVTAKTDAAAKNVLTMLTDRTATVLDELQAVESIPEANRMTVIPVTVDEQSIEESRSRFLAAAGAGIVGILLTLVIASLACASGRAPRERESARDSDDPNETGVVDPTGPATAAISPTPPEHSVRFAQPGHELQFGQPLQFAQPVQPEQPSADPADDVPVPATPRARVKW